MAQDTFVPPVILPSGTTFAQFQGGGLAVVLKNMLAANATPLTAPTVAATVAVTGGGSIGGALAAGNYYALYTWLTGLGETTAGTANASESAVFTVVAGNIPRITFPALPTGATALNLYLTAVGGATGTETLYATGITATTFDCSYAAGSDPAKPTPPTADTTLNQSAFLALPSSQAGWSTLTAIEGMIDCYLRGNAMPFADLRGRFLRKATVLNIYAAAMNEIGVLIANNPGTLTTTTDKIGHIYPVRTFP